MNPPLASTAVGVVPPQRAGMASGINSTFRQVGIATGIALLGTLFSSQVKSSVEIRRDGRGRAVPPGAEDHCRRQFGEVGSSSRGSGPGPQNVGVITHARSPPA